MLQTLIAAGWIGSWSPRIGDPNAIGWLTVVLYLVAAGLCHWLARAKPSRREARLWRVLAASFLALGINKQLDLQTALTELGRMMARSEGWYGNRRPVQAAFVACVAVLGLAAAAALWSLARRAPHATRQAVAGTALVITFVVIRAASFHYVDKLLGLRWIGIRVNWVLEMGGISIVIAAALRRAGELGLLRGRSRRLAA